MQVDTLPLLSGDNVTETLTPFWDLMTLTWESGVPDLARFRVSSHIRCQSIGSSAAPVILSQITCHDR